MASITKFYNIGEYNGWSWFGDHGVPRVDIVATSGNDWYQIGNAYSFHHGILAKDTNKRHNRGNIGSLLGQGETTVDMGDGDDRIDTGMNAYDGQIDWTATDDPGNIWQNAIVKMGTGNDILNVGQPHDYNSTPANTEFDANIHGGQVYMGAGHDKVSVRSDIDGGAKVYLDNVNSNGTGDGNDKMVVGGDIGDLLNLSKANSPKIDAGGGDDEIRVGGKIQGHSHIDMQEGNNYLSAQKMHQWSEAHFANGNDLMEIRGSVTDSAIIKMDDDNPSEGGYWEWTGEIYIWVEGGFGDDTLNVGHNIDGILTGARVDMGGGKDILNVGNVIGGTAKVDMGDGENVATIKDGIVFRSTVDFGKDNDTLNVTNNITWKSAVSMGDGDNVINVGGGLVDFATLTSGSGSDTFMLDGITNLSTFNSGAGNDTVNVNHLDFYAKVHLGAGDDNLNISETFGWGAVQDRLLLKNSGAKVWMGEGDDILTYGGKAVTGVIDGGQGNDTVILTYDTDNSLVSGSNTWFKEATNLSTLNLKGVENVVMQGNNVIDVKYEDLLTDPGRDGNLFIRGNDASKVDLGATDWNGDTDTWLNEWIQHVDPLNITGKGSWAKTGSETVDGVSYDVYHHSFAGSNTHNDVYIEQGVMVI